MDKYLLNPEEISKLYRKREYDAKDLNKGYSCWTDYLLQAQHIKSIKAVLEELEKNISASIYSSEAGENVHCISAYMWLKIKKELLENCDKLEGK